VPPLRAHALSRCRERTTQGRDHIADVTEKITEIIETAPAPFQMPAVDPLLMPLMLPFMLIQQLSLALMQMSMPPMMQPMMQAPMGGQAQQTIVKLGYDKDGNISSIYERRW